MVKQFKINGIVKTMATGISIGLGTGLIFTLLGAVLLTTMLNGEQLSLDAIGMGILVVNFMATFLAAIVAMVCIKSHKMQVSMITAGAYMLVLLACNALFFSGEYSGVGSTLLVVTIAGAVAGFIGAGGGKSLKRKGKYWGHGKIAQ